ncbi:hypothetical protein [Tessaracoccus flavescens]|uniref:Tryptophan synthase n=1 Tax=Tessaracoccus flavescens TaxID=399497 RepID=A0A1Q2CZI7_9ACTN|nr:hypothetical protein [Tessaracoccus flavescens]AQP51454.1 hypothetical protein BW733_12155 [Tessaracoccus flavescens]
MNPRYPTLAACIARLRELGVRRPIYCGVGVATPADYPMVEESGGDGDFVGSTILKLYDQPVKLAETIGQFKASASR